MTNKELKSILNHILIHLDQNKIEQSPWYGAWYRGNKAQFIERHIKAKEFIEETLKVIK